MPYIDTETEKFYDTTQSLSKDFPHTSIPLNTTNDILSINVVYIPLPKIEKYTESKMYSIKHELLDGEWSLFWESKDLSKDSLAVIERSNQEVLNRLIERCDEHDQIKMQSNLIEYILKQYLELEDKIEKLKSSKDSEEQEKEVNSIKAIIINNKKTLSSCEENIKNNTLSVPKEISDYKESLLDLTKKEKWYIDTVFPKTPEEL